MRLAAVVITYYPDVEETALFIQRYLPHVDQLIIWNNTPLVDQNKYNLEITTCTDKIISMGVGSNVGIGFALNRVIEWASLNNYTHLLTMDQDSCFESANFVLFKEIIDDYKSQSDVILFSPRLSSAGLPIIDEIEDVRFTITSGSILNLDLVNIVGLFREDFFIDAIDTEYSIRGWSLNFRTVMINRCILNQRFGDARRSKWGFISSDYSSFRTYHMVRNHIIVWKLFPNLFSFTDAFKIYVFERVIKIILSEKNKFPKIKAIFRGIKDGLSGRIVPYNKIG